MASINYGKKFEERFKLDFISSMKDSSIDRIYDTMSEYKNIHNICDFICYKYPFIFYIEVKSHKGNTFPLRNLTQYDMLLQKVGIPGVRSGVLIWFIEHDRIIYVPISTIQKMKQNNEKSVNIRTIDKSNYRFFEISSTKLIKFLKADYNILMTTQDYD